MKRKSRKKSKFYFSGSCIDLESGKKVHKYGSSDFDDFEEFFTKTMRRKLR